MRLAFQLSLRFMPGIFFFLAGIFCQPPFSKPLAAQSQSKLRLSAEIIDQNYCSVNADTLSLQLRLRLRYTNLTTQRLIIYQGHDLFYQTKLRAEATAQTPPSEVVLLDMHYFDEQFERIDAPAPGKVFAKLAPGNSIRARDQPRRRRYEQPESGRLLCTTGP